MRRVLRGGSWFDYPDYLRASLRGRNVPGLRDLNLGFRLACEVDGEIPDEDFQRLRVEASEFNKELLARLGSGVEG